MKAIILYASKYGCTEKAAKLLQAKLLQAKLPEGIKIVNVEKEKAPELSSYDTVILGGPIYVGKMHGPLTTFMRQNLEVLKKKKVALFLCEGEQDPALIGKQLSNAFPEELCKRAIIREDFGGELRMANVGVVMRFILRSFIGVKGDYSRLSEEKIDQFAKGILAVQV